MHKLQLLSRILTVLSVLGFALGSMAVLGLSGSQPGELPQNLIRVIILFSPLMVSSFLLYSFNKNSKVIYFYSGLFFIAIWFALVFFNPFF